MKHLSTEKTDEEKNCLECFYNDEISQDHCDVCMYPGDNFKLKENKMSDIDLQWAINNVKAYGDINSYQKVVLDLLRLIIQQNDKIIELLNNRG